MLFLTLACPRCGANHSLPLDDYGCFIGTLPCGSEVALQVAMDDVLREELQLQQEVVQQMQIDAVDQEIPLPPMRYRES